MSCRRVPCCAGPSHDDSSSTTAGGESGAAPSGEQLPAHVTRDQARAIVNVVTSKSHRLLLECPWQSGGRISEVLRLRPCDVDATEGALVLENRKQKKGNRRKRVYVSADLAQLQILARGQRLGDRGFYFR